MFETVIELKRIHRDRGNTVALTKAEVDQIADAMVERVKLTQHTFWIDPETHYQDHIAMREVVGSWTTGKGIFTKAFIGLVVIGSITLAFVGFIKGH